MSGWPPSGAKKPDGLARRRDSQQGRLDISFPRPRRATESLMSATLFRSPEYALSCIFSVHSHSNGYQAIQNCIKTLSAGKENNSVNDSGTIRPCTVAALIFDNRINAQTEMAQATKLSFF